MAKKPARPKAEKKPKADKARAAKDAAARSKSGSKGTKKVKAPKAGTMPGEQVRKIWGGKPLRDFADAVIIAQDRASKAGGSVGQMITEKVKGQGLDGPAFRLAVRVLKTARRDPNAGRVLYDDILFYLDELEVEKACGEQLFAPREGADDGEEDGDDETTDLPPEDGDGEFSEGDGDGDGDNVHRLQRTGTDG